jgi:hypothetical protein
MYIFWENIIHIEPLCTGKRDLEVFLNKLPSATDTKEEHCTMHNDREGQGGGRRNSRERGERAESGNAGSIISNWLCMSIS